MDRQTLWVQHLCSTEWFVELLGTLECLRHEVLILLVIYNFT